jgi:hypothetical protein
MKAVLSERPGSADLLKVVQIETPAVPDDGVLVRSTRPRSTLWTWAGAAAPAGISLP